MAGSAQENLQAESISSLRLKPQPPRVGGCHVKSKAPEVLGKMTGQSLTACGPEANSDSCFYPLLTR